MPIAVVSEPTRWSSCYRPIVFELSSDLFPNATLGEVGIPLQYILRNSYGQVNFQTIAPFGTYNLSAGDTIEITATDNGLYLGTWRVLSVEVQFGNLLNVIIDAPYQGDETGGFVSRQYPDLRIVCSVVFPAFGRTVEIELRPDENYRFFAHLEDICARQFESVFDHVTPGGSIGLAGSGDKCIATGFDVLFTERYTKWEAGVPTVTEGTSGAIKLRGFRAVNMVHPYFRDGDGPDLDWSTDIGSVFPMGAATGASTRPALTYASRTEQVVEAGDNFLLAVLCDTNAENNWTLSATSYLNGSPISIQGALITTLPTYAAVFAIGPAQLPGLLTNADSYLIRIQNRNGQDILEPFTLKYTPCVQSEVSRRIWWQNKLGGIDQFTFRGRETERPTATREMVTRLSNPVPVGSDYRGGWMERVSRVIPTRTKTLSSIYVSALESRWLTEDCFESHDHALYEKKGWWTRLVMESTDAVPFGTDNVAQRFSFDYHRSVDNMSQRG